MRRGLLPTMGSRIAEVLFPPCPYKPIRMAPARATFRRLARQRQIVAVDRIGKRLLVRLDQGHAIVFEPRMTGLVLLSAPPDEAHVRFGLRLEGREVNHLWYWDRRGLGSVQLLSTQQQQQQLGPERLGPDALSVGPDQLQTRLAGSRRAVKVALLDQRAMAGVGNLYASELLHVAGVHPEKRCDLLSQNGWRRIGVAMHQVLREAIHYEGSTLSDGTYRNALNQAGQYQNHHRVYNRQGQSCPRCFHGRIRRIVQAQRSTFFCPKCQTKRA